MQALATSRRCRDCRNLAEITSVIRFSDQPRESRPPLGARAYGAPFVKWGAHLRIVRSRAKLREPTGIFETTSTIAHSDGGRGPILPLPGTPPAPKNATIRSPVAQPHGLHLLFPADDRRHLRCPGTQRQPEHVPPQHPPQPQEHLQTLVYY